MVFQEAKDQVFSWGSRTRVLLEDVWKGKSPAKEVREQEVPSESESHLSDT